jgi:hypothetical protein
MLVFNRPPWNLELRHVGRPFHTVGSRNAAWQHLLEFVGAATVRTLTPATIIFARIQIWQAKT